MPSFAFVLELMGSGVGATFRRVSSGPRRPTWSWGFEVVADAMKKRAHAIGARDWQAQRELWSEMTAPPSPVLRAMKREPTEVAGMRAEWFVPESPRGVVLYIHGGSFIYGSIATHAEMIARVAAATGARVLAFEYRLAPEHPFPAALDDVLAAYRALLEQGHPRVALAGDSAGGNLAAVATMVLVAANEAPAGAILLSPWVDLGARGGSLEAHAAYDYAEPGDFTRWAEAYTNGADLADPRVSPLFGRFEGLPPLLIVVGTAEMLLDQVRAFAAKARAAGVTTELFEHEDMIHNGIAFAAMFERCREVEARIAAYARAHLA